MIDVMCVVEKKKMYDLRQFFLLENWITNRFWREEKKFLKQNNFIKKSFGNVSRELYYILESKDLSCYPVSLMI